MIGLNNLIHSQQEEQGFPCTWYEVAIDKGESEGTESIFGSPDVEECKKWAKENITSVKEQNGECTLFCDLWEHESEESLPMPKTQIFTESDILEGYI